MHKKIEKYIENINIENLGFYRVFVSSPKNKVGDIQQNKINILNEITKAEKLDANFVLFPQLSLSSATCGVLFSQRVLLQNAFDALLDLCEATKNRKIVSIISLPLFFENKVYSVAAVIFAGKILGFVPLKLPQHLIAYFTNTYAQVIDFIEGIPFSADLKFNVKAEYAFSFGIGDAFFGKNSNAIPELLFMPLAAASSPLLHEKLDKRFSVLSEENNVAICFANAGIGESSSNFVFLGECGIFENGVKLASSSYTVSSLESSSCFADIDIELLQAKKANKALSETFYANNDKRSFNATNCKEKNIFIDLRDKLRDKDNLAKFLHLKHSSNTKSLKRPVSQKAFLNSSIDNLYQDSLYQNSLRTSSSAEEYYVNEKNAFFKEIIFMQALSLVKRLEHINCQKCVLGLSGGLDSSLALLVCLYAFDILNIPHKNLYTVLLPSFGTTTKTKSNAGSLAELLDCSVLEIDIKDAVLQHFKDIEHDENTQNIVFENAQARERTQVLMDLANKIGGIMIGTGDLSEGALGWTTYNGDHISMYELNASIPKTFIPDCLLAFVQNNVFFDNEKNNLLKDICLNIINTPVSPELLPPKNDEIVQETEKIIGPYDLHDFFLYHLIENSFSPTKIFYLACVSFFEKYSMDEILSSLEIFYKRFFSQQFKRSASAEGASVSAFSLSARSAWKMPSDVINKIWLGELEQLHKIV